MSMIILGTTLLMVFIGLHSVPAYRTSKTYRRAIQGWGLAFVVLICLLTLVALDALIGLMIESGYPVEPYTAWTFHWHYLIALAILMTMFGAVMLYRRIVKRLV
jgi:hypothetical protein